MSDAVIRVEGLGKRYRIAPVRRADAGWRGRLPWLRGRCHDLWALRDVSFSVDAGEVVGVIGRNGAGKSTLLKVLSGITNPTAGRALLRGRLASLLEVGTGFHPDLTGRENVYLNGALLGMNRAEIRRKFDQIVDFAEVEEFLDTPIKRFSTGMQMRLAFAVAAHLDSEILIVDEALSVGDAAFQAKCVEATSEARQRGRTVLVVSHNMAVLRGWASRVLLLDEGRLKEDGSLPEVLSRYLTASRDA
ncbi:MAG: ABC transporter ATP-binding protein, partial [Phycisphaerae bacterium]|nr:ABC transporter ATP-binding protein [Phycisphaerae bacterium]